MTAASGIVGGAGDTEPCWEFDDTATPIWAIHRLWHAVLIMAASDAAGVSQGIRGGTLARARAVSWIGTTDFQSVCDFAGFSPELAAAGIRRLAAMDAEMGRTLHQKVERLPSVGRQEKARTV